VDLRPFQNDRVYSNNYRDFQLHKRQVGHFEPDLADLPSAKCLKSHTGQQGLAKGWLLRAGSAIIRGRQGKQPEPARKGACAALTGRFLTYSLSHHCAWSDIQEKASRINTLAGVLVVRWKSSMKTSGQTWSERL